MQPTIQQTIIADAIKVIAPLCTLVPLKVDDVRSKSREIKVVIQKALVVYYMRHVKKHKLEYIASEVSYPCIRNKPTKI